MKNITLELNKFSKALDSLERIYSRPIDTERLIMDASIQRFEFTFELCWKTLKVFLNQQGINVQYPKDTLKEAYQKGLIDDEHSWLMMLADRNLTSHTYEENTADELFQRLGTYVPLFQKLLQTLQQECLKNT